MLSRFMSGFFCAMTGFWLWHSMYDAATVSALGAIFFRLDAYCSAMENRHE